MPSYPSGSAYFGTGLAQGLSQALSQLPALLKYQQEQDLKTQLLDLEKKKLTLGNQELELKIKQAGMKPGDSLKNVFEELQNMGVLKGASPVANTGGGLQQSIIGSPEVGEGSNIPMSMPTGQIGVPEAVAGQLQQASQPQQPQGGTASPDPSMELKGLTIDSATGAVKAQLGNVQYNISDHAVEVSPGQYKIVKMWSDPSRPGAMFQKEIPGGPVPGAEVQAAVRAAEGMGAPKGAGADHIASMILAARVLPPAEQAQAMIQLQKEAQQLASGGAPSGGLDVQGAITGARQEKTAATEQEAAAKTRGSTAAGRKMVTGVMDKMSAALKNIKLPKDGPERISESPRLLQESLSQSNPSIVEFETLKAGFLATVARAVGERGVLTDQDAARAAALFPNVKPGKGHLPDTKTIADNKMKDLKDLIGEFSQRDPGFAKDIGATGGSSKTLPGGGTIDSVTFGQ